MRRQFIVLLLALGCASASAFAAALTNPSFEQDTYTVWPGYAAGNGGVITGWTASGSGNTTDPLSRVGINSNPPTWNPPNTSPFGNNGVYPDGTQVGFIQAASSTTLGATTTLSNTITDLTPGETYRVDFNFNARAGQFPNATASVGDYSVNFRVNSVEGGNFFTQPFRTGSLVFTATAPTATISLSNFSPAAATAIDTTLVIDHFRVASGDTGWRASSWSSDATSGVDGSLLYSHAYNFGSELSPVINGVTFTGVAGGNPAVGGSFSTTGWTTPLADTANELVGTASGSAELASNFVYGGASQTVQTLTLDGLTPGVLNRLTFFGVSWSDAASIARSATFSDGAGDMLTMDEHMFGAVDRGIKFELDFVPTGATQTFSLSPTTTTTTMHIYGFSNAVVPEPSTAGLLGLAGLLLGTRRRRK